MFDFLCFDLIITTVALCFQALKEKEDPVVEDAPTETPPGDRHEIAVDVEVVKIAYENLVMRCNILSARIFDYYC
jgi:hypothetical protein